MGTISYQYKHHDKKNIHIYTCNEDKTEFIN